MKKLLPVMISFLLCMSLTACGEDKSAGLSSDTALPSSSAPELSETPEPTATAEPTPEVTPEPTPLPEPVVYTGSGDDVITISPPDEKFVFYIEGNSGERHFAVKGYDENGDKTKLLVNTTDAYSGILVDPTLKTTSLEITSAGDWHIELRSLDSCKTIAAGETVTGSGDDVLLVADYGSTATITGNEAGRHFAVKTYGNSGNNLMVNTTDPYSGTVPIKKAPTVLEVSAKDEWSITFD